MAKHLWHDLQGAFDSAIDADGSYEFNLAAAAMLTAIQQWLYDEGFDDAGDSLDEEILTAENEG
jgi:hypothetical protein